MPKKDSLTNQEDVLNAELPVNKPITEAAAITINSVKCMRLFVQSVVSPLKYLFAQAEIVQCTAETVLAKSTIDNKIIDDYM
jgi:hypothetical protein